MFSDGKFCEATLELARAGAIKKKRKKSDRERHYSCESLVEKNLSLEMTQRVYLSSYFQTKKLSNGTPFPCEAICAEMTRSGRREQYCEMINMIICSSSRGQPITPSSAFIQLYKHLTQNLNIKLNKYTYCGDMYFNKGWTPCLAGPSPAHNQPAPSWPANYHPSTSLEKRLPHPILVHCCTCLSVGMSWNDQDKEPMIDTKIIQMGN